ncbi:MAG: CARDB domain-containing protein [Solirubrobacterales bacterium]
MTALRDAQNPDGGLGGRLETRDSATTLEALNLVSPNAAQDQDLRDFVTAITPHNVDDLSRLLASSSSATWAAALLAEQNPDGGFGLTHEYETDALDTALAARGLALSDHRAAMKNAITRLLKLGLPSGSWGHDTGDIPLTAETGLALIAAREVLGSSAALDLSIVRTASWLTAQQQSNGSWGDDEFGVRTTSQALTVLARSATGSVQVESATDWLISSQRIDGSWGGPYTTALAVRALHDAGAAVERARIASLPDPSIGERDISVTPSSVEAGAPLTVTAVVSNYGSAEARGVTAEFFIGEPTIGSTPASVVDVPDINPGQQIPITATFDAAGSAGRKRVYVNLRPAPNQDRIASNNSTFANVAIRASERTYAAVRDWPRPGHDIQRSGKTPNNLHAGIDPNPLWRNPASGGAIAAQGKVYYGSGGTVHAVNPTTGVLAWSGGPSFTDAEKYRAPIYNQGYIYAGGVGGMSILSAETGALKNGIGSWGAGGELGIWLDVIPNERGYDAVVVANPANDGTCRVEALKDPTGGFGGELNYIWTTTAAQLDRPCHPKTYSYASDGTHAFGASGSGYLNAWDITTFEGPNGESDTFTFDVRLPGTTRVPTGPMVDSLGQVIIGGWDGTVASDGTPTHSGKGRVSAVDPRTGQPFWSFETDTKIDGTPVGFRDSIIVTDRSGSVYALNAATGALQWRWQAANYTPPAPEAMGLAGQTLALSRHYLYVPHPDGSIHTLDARSGGQLSETPFPARPYDLAIDDHNNLIYVRTLDGFVGAYPTRELPDQCEPDPANTAPASGKVRRASEFTDGSSLPGRAVEPAHAMFDNGRYVAFSLNEGLSNEDRTNHLYVRDLDTGVTTEEPYSEQLADGYTRTGSRFHSVSTDGRFVLFHSEVYVPSTARMHYPLFIRDRQLGATTPVLVNPDGSPNLGQPWIRPSGRSDISNDGQTVVFTSDDASLVAGDTNGVADVFAVNVSSQQVSRVSAGPDGEQLSQGGSLPSISADGRFVAYLSDGNPVDPTQSTPGSNVFVLDRATGDTIVASRNRDGSIGAYAKRPEITASGDFVTFESEHPGLLPLGIPLGGNDIHIFERSTGRTEIASLNDAGSRGTHGWSVSPVASDDGRYVAFQTRDILAKGDATYPFLDDVVVRDRNSDRTALVSQNPYGVSTGGESQFAAISSDGKRIAFSSTAVDLEPGDINGTRDVFVYARDGWGEAPSTPGDPSGAGCPPDPDPTDTEFSDLSIDENDVGSGPLEQGQAGSINATIRNQGAAVSEESTVQLFDGDERSGALLAEHQLAAMAPGDETQLTFTWDPVAAPGVHDLTVVIDPNRTVFESQLANNVASHEVVVAAPQFAMSTATGQTTYGSNETSHFVTTIETNSIVPRDGRLAVVIADSDGEEISRLHDEQISVSPGQPLSVASSWDTLDTTAGSYTVRATITDDAGEQLASSETVFSIAPQLDASISTFTDQQIYSPSATATITSVVSNDSNNAPLEGSTVDLLITGPGGVIVDGESLPVGETVQGGAVASTKVLPLQGLTPGEYEVQTVLRASGGSQLDTASTEFTIESSSESGANVSGTITASSTDPIRLSTQTFSYAITNAGNADIASATVVARIADLTTGDEVRVLEITRDVTRVAPTTGSLSTVMDMPEDRDYQVGLYLRLANGVERPLARTIVRVRPNPFTAGSTLSTSSVNRVLVWACDPRDEAAARAALGDTFVRVVPNLRSSRYTGRIGCTFFNHEEEAEFMRELRSGSYNQFWLLGAHHPFHHDHADELAARVLQGDSFLLAGGDPVLDLFRHSGNESPIGAQLAGILPHGTHTMKFAANSAFAGLDTAVTGNPIRVTTTRATAIATTAYSWLFFNKLGITGTTNQFGSGRAIFLGSSPKSFASAPAAAEVLAKAAETLAPSAGPARAGGVATLESFVEGTAPGTPLEIRSQFPTGASILRSPSDSTFAGGLLTVPFPTTGTERRSRQSLVKLPVDSASITIQSEVFYRVPSGNSMQPFGSPFNSSITITENKADAKADASSALNNIGSVGFLDGLALAKIKNDVAASTQPAGSSSITLSRLRALVDDLGIIERNSWTNKEPARQAVARLITYLQYDYYLATGGG